MLNDLNPILPLAGYQAIAKTENGIEGLRMAQRIEPDLILTGWDIKGLSALDLIQNLVHAHICPVILILEDRNYNNLLLAIKTNVHHIITVPLRAVDVISGIMQAEYRFNKECEYLRNIRLLRDEVKTRKLIYQAILTLIPMGYTEETAYAAMRKRAMSTRKTICSVADDILKGKWKPHEES